MNKIKYIKKYMYKNYFLKKKSSDRLNWDVVLVVNICTTIYKNICSMLHSTLDFEVYL